MEIELENKALLRKLCDVNSDLRRSKQLLLNEV